MALFRYIAVFAALGVASIPVMGQGKILSPKSSKTAVLIDSASLRAINSKSQQPLDQRANSIAQVALIPSVIGNTITEAMNVLSWTKLVIVPIESTNTDYSAGTVFRQRPQAGTPVGRARAETLYVARARRSPDSPKVNPWKALLESLAVAAVTRKPRPVRSPSDVPGVFIDTTAKVPGTRSGDTVVVPGKVTQDRILVPDLHGFTQQMVVAALQKNRLRSVNLGQDYSDEVPAGRVFRQSPRAETEAVTGSSVAVWYSRGSSPVVAKVTIPGVVGLGLRDAVDSLKRTGFRAGQVDYVRRSDGGNTVVTQAPHEGDAGRRGDIVDLTIATAPSRVVVPSVTGLTREGARARLRDSGLGVGRVTVVTLVSAGLGILSQRPAPTSEVDSATLVDLVENRRAEVRRVPVPNVIGKTLASADSALQRDSLIVGEIVRRGIRDSIVVKDQRPQAGETVFVHSPVALALGDTMTGFPVPRVVGLTVDSARRILADSGFRRVSINGRGEALTSASVVESQIPTAGTVFTSDAIVSLAAIGPDTPDPVPNLVGRKREEARLIADINNLALVVSSEVRKLRLHEEVVSQDPAAQSARRADNTIGVVVEVPAIPPPLAAVLALVVVGGGPGGVGLLICVAAGVGVIFFTYLCS
ncbi:MAG: PASTA domain-containing protein [Gemmatimonadales bacterium]